jgi:ABC-2 type transport system ATP-binding protein
MRHEPISGKMEIRASNLRVSYGKVVALEVEEFSLKGRIIGVIGHNGSGKSTMLKTILKLLMPRSGSIETLWIQGDTKTLLVPEKHMAFSPENGAIFEDMPVESYIELWCRIKQHDGNYYKKEGSHYLERLNVTPLLGKLGRELSKGQRRRVQAAVGFLTSPQLFLFDEPFDGLDIVQSNELTNVMLQESTKMSMIVSSHRMEVIERLADMVVVLHEGRVFTAGAVDEVCKTLGGNSVLISESQNQQIPLEILLQMLRKEFISCLINQIGSQLLVTGNNISVETLRTFFLKQHLQGIKLNPARPSLVDAMRYYLNKLN